MPENTTTRCGCHCHLPQHDMLTCDCLLCCVHCCPFLTEEEDAPAPERAPCATRGQEARQRVSA